MKKKDFPLPFLLPLCRRILKLIKRLGIRDFPEKKEVFERLCAGGDADVEQEEQACRCIAYMLVIAFAAVVILLATENSVIVAHRAAPPDTLRRVTVSRMRRAAM